MQTTSYRFVVRLGDGGIVLGVLRDWSKCPSEALEHIALAHPNCEKITIKKIKEISVKQSYSASALKRLKTLR